MNVRTHPWGEADDSGEGPSSDFGPADAVDCAPVSIESQIECVKREIGMREHVYPRRVADQKMTQSLADRELANMRAVLATLEALPKTQPGLF